MKNQEIAKIFYEIADYLEMDEVPFKPYAYQRAAIGLESIEEGVEDIYKRGGIGALKEIPGVGESIARSIEEYLKTGRIKYYEQFKKRLPINLQELISVEGMGPKKARILYQKLGIRNLKDLEKAAKAGKISHLFGFGEKTEKNILEGIAFFKKSKGRFLLGEILPKVREIQGKLKNFKEVERVDVAGSLRRRKETIGDVDFLVISKHPSKVMDFFVSLPEVVKIWSKGTTKASVRTKGGFDMDIRVVPQKSYGSALQYFTGSKEHNIVTRRIAIDKGFKLSEYGLFMGKKMIASETEEEIYKKLGMPWVEPELRENQGEIQAAQEHKLPKIIGYNDIKGDLHVHEKDSSIEELAEAAQEMGYEYLGISDHTKSLYIEHGLGEKQLIKRNKRIDNLNKDFKNFKILKGAEVNIMKNGLMDIKDEVLAQMDYVIAGIHSLMKMPKDQMTERIIKAMKNPNIDIISHPTGRLLKERDEYQIDLDKILKAAKETGTILEINGSPNRLDLNDQNIRKAKKAGVKMVINTDSHHAGQLRLMEFGVSQARRGWAEKEDIVNCWPLEKLLKYFK
ncbi:MAG: DNA polymerase/3'-5' exonuclease PolX [Candidatus Nealsonbacteria bacterium]|nr:DNA polymerase/3'-5' exonuclease PolX [Candidatus Nealsonbacteria bacterium]